METKLLLVETKILFQLVANIVHDTPHKAFLPQLVSLRKIPSTQLKSKICLDLCKIRLDN